MSEEPRVYRRSVSQMKSATKCGERYRLEKLVRPRIPRIEAAWSFAGTAFHEAAEFWERENREGSIAERFAPIFDREFESAKERQPDFRYWQKVPGRSNIEDVKKYRERFLKHDCVTYETYCRTAPWEVMRLLDGELALELEFSVQLGEVEVVGAIDRLLWWPEEGIVTIDDLKTGRADDDDDSRQLLLYGYAVQKIFDIDISRGRYYYTKPRLERPGAWVELRDINEQQLIEDYRILNETIQQNLLLPNPGDQCGLCGVKRWCRLKGWEELPTEEVENE